MNDIKKACDLCGLVVEIAGFELNTKQGIKNFCCEGCKGIYQMLHEEQTINEPVKSPNDQ